MKELADAGIPMRKCVTSGILHWKAMIFAGQNTVEFGGANYSAWALTPEQPYINYTDEVIYFTDRSSIVQSFMTKFDDLWTSTSFADYANMLNPPTREYSEVHEGSRAELPADRELRLARRSSCTPRRPPAST